MSTLEWRCVNCCAAPSSQFKVILVTSRSQDKIFNIDDFDAILDRKTIKDGGLNNIVKNLIS